MKARPTGRLAERIQPCIVRMDAGVEVCYNQPMRKK
jgi:hypothetical protein